MEKLEIKNTVSSLIINKEGKILLLKRSMEKKFDPGVWNIVSGWLPDNVDPRVHILTEIKEELSVDAHILLGPINWRVFRANSNFIMSDYTFLIELDSEEITIEREHSEYKWIDIKELENYNTWEFLKENLHNLGISKTDDTFKLLYTNYKKETKWRFIKPLRYHYGSTEWHPSDQWLLECFDLEKKENRNYSVEDIQVFIPPIFI